MNIGIIGGDLRIAKLAQMYAKEKNTVNILGFEKYFTDNVENINLFDNMENLIEKSDFIISGIPFSRDDISINAPFSNTELEIRELKDKLGEKRLFAGGIKNFFSEEYNAFDLLESEKLTIMNAIATVEGTIKIALDEREESIHESKVLVCGFGRIGKIMCDRFKNLGADVYCTARKEKDLTWIRENRYIPLTYPEIPENGEKFDLIINTVPKIILEEKELKSFKKGILIIDVASNPGGIDKISAEKLGIKVITALGIPGKEFPKSAAKYIKEVINEST